MRRPTPSNPALWLLLAAFVAGCKGNDDTDTDDTDTDSGDTTPPTVVSSDPTDAASPVSVWATLSATLSEALDEATVDETTVVLEDRSGVAVSGTLILDGTATTLTFEPDLPLRYGEDYTWTVGGAEDPSGNPIDPTTLSFQTYANPETLSIGYFEGYLDHVTHIESDAHGNWTAQHYFYSPGQDGIWHTEDDAEGDYYAWTYDADQREIREAVYIGAGVDSTWSTADDVLSWYQDVTYDG
ncbi:MAG: Ig-like domain-containing protein, partial [Deltaproteobacteria bacterium]|nr:Ig-like domain-containing protein [Deltaproteobacteria bacterium]